MTLTALSLSLRLDGVHICHKCQVIDYCSSRRCPESCTLRNPVFSVCKEPTVLMGEATLQFQLSVVSAQIGISQDALEAPIP